MLIQEKRYKEDSIRSNLLQRLRTRDYIRVETAAKSNKTDIWTIRRIVHNHPYLEINKVFGKEFIQLTERWY